MKQLDTDRLRKIVTLTDYRRFITVIEWIKRGITLEKIHKATKIAMYFLECIALIVKLENEAKPVNIDTVTKLQLLNLKQWAFTNETLAKMWNCSVKAVETKLKQYSITVHYDKIHAYSAKINDHEAY